MKNSFYYIALKYFNYLVTDYNFILRDLKDDPEASDFEGRIEFESPTTFVTISGLKWTTGVIIGRAKDNRNIHFLDPYVVYEFRNLSEADKKIVCSHAPLDDRKAREIIFNFRLSSKRINKGNTLENIEAELIEYSNWLRQYSEAFLRGDFSQWLNVYEYKVVRTQAEYARSGKSEIGLRIIGKEPSGKPLYEKRSIFQDDIDYLETLKEEYQKK